ncbi:unnamed protein product [Phytophthora lilii]|uniref:Unnamed protein product n=1 Tax=Phytophthora lilii TaxID=2077276 RepID=A0A9W6X0B0_9STRA|nr:unnamed protein product [Phytophthora lilii]
MLTPTYSVTSSDVARFRDRLRMRQDANAQDRFRRRKYREQRRQERATLCHQVEILTNELDPTYLNTAKRDEVALQHFAGMVHTSGSEDIPEIIALLEKLLR